MRPTVENVSEGVVLNQGDILYEKARLFTTFTSVKS